jgi:hypothetical protein
MGSWAHGLGVDELRWMMPVRPGDVLRRALAELIVGIVVHKDRLIVRLKPDSANEASDSADDQFNSLAETAGQKIPSDPASTWCISSRSQPGTVRAAGAPGQRYRARRSRAVEL